MARLKRVAEAEGKLDEPLFAAKVAQVEIDLMALEITNLRVLCAESAAAGEKRAPGPEASILKIKGTEIQQSISELLMQAAGRAALAFGVEGVGPAHAARLGTSYCNLRKLSIYGGSNEIQKNIISQMIMGL